MYIIFAGGLEARSASEQISGLTPEEALELSKAAIDKMGGSYKEVDKTIGFDFRLSSKLFSPLVFDLYITAYKSGSMIHVESPNRMADGILDMILIENKAGPFANSYKSKSHVVGLALNWVAPSFGMIYTNINTPFARNYSAAYVAGYLGIDLLLMGIGGSGFFQHSFDPFGEGLTETLILLGLHRLVQSYPVFTSISAQNRAVKLGYTFRY